MQLVAASCSNAIIDMHLVYAVFFAVIFIGSFHSPDAIFEQLSVIYAIPRYLARSVIFILPYFPTGTMERVDREGQIATAKVMNLSALVFILLTYILNHNCKTFPLEVNLELVKINYN